MCIHVRKCLATPLLAHSVVSLLSWYTFLQRCYDCQFNVYLSEPLHYMTCFSRWNIIRLGRTEWNTFLPDIESECRCSPILYQRSCSEFLIHFRLIGPACVQKGSQSISVVNSKFQGPPNCTFQISQHSICPPHMILTEVFHRISVCIGRHRYVWTHVNRQVK